MLNMGGRHLLLLLHHVSGEDDQAHLYPTQETASTIGRAKDNAPEAKVCFVIALYGGLGLGEVAFAIAVFCYLISTEAATVYELSVVAFMGL